MQDFIRKTRRGKNLGVYGKIRVQFTMGFKAMRCGGGEGPDSAVVDKAN
jgi:hypothetical protein